MAAIFSPKSFNDYQTQYEQYLIARSSKLNNFNIGSRLKTIGEAINNVLAIDSADFYLALRKAIPTAIYTGFEFSAKTGDEAVGSINFGRNEPATVARTINPGTRIILGEFTYETIAAGEILVGNTNSSDIASSATAIGEDGNLGIGDIDTKNGKGTIANPPSGVEFAFNNQVFFNGTNQESEEARRQRFQDFINGLARSNLRGIITGLNSIDGLISFFLKNLFPEPGYVTVFAEDAPGTLTPAKKAEIEKVLLGDENDLDNFPGYIAFGISLVVLPPIVVPIDQEFTIIIRPDSALVGDIPLQTEFLTNAKNALVTFINSKTIGSDIIISEEVQFLQNFDPEVFDIGLVDPAFLSENVIVAAEQVPRTGGGTGGDITLNLAVATST